MAHYIGLDLGGTNIKSGVVDDRGQIVAKLSRPTRPETGPDGVLASMVDAAREAADAAKIPLAQIAGVGIGCPGPLDFQKGLVKAAPNLPGWDHVPVRDHIARALGRPAVLENDANAAAFGEFWVGAGRDVQDMVMLTLGTGVGSGLVVEGKIIHGADGLGGEAGHLIVQPNGRRCGCGQRGCLEQYASASSVPRRALDAMAAGRRTILKPTRADGAEIDAQDVFAAAQQGDELALGIVEETAFYLGIGCVNLCRLLDPQMIVFAGGMIHAGEFLFDRVRRVFGEHSWTITDNHVQIVPAKLGSDAGLIGAAAVAQAK
jgi:glucokinase